MATLSVQESVFTGLQYTNATTVAAGGDVFANEGNTFILFTNGSASTRTVTFAGNAASKPGFGDISAADMGEAVTIPGSGTNGGRIMIGPFPRDRFNNSSGQVSMTYSDSGADLTVGVIKLRQYA